MNCKDLTGKRYDDCIVFKEKENKTKTNINIKLEEKEKLQKELQKRGYKVEFHNKDLRIITYEEVEK